MEYIHIANIEQYQPHYKDGRNIIWIRWNIGALRKYKLSKLTPSQRWLFLALICLESENKKPVVNDREWLALEIKYPIKHISNNIKYLQKMELVVISCDEMLQDVTKCALQTDKQTDSMLRYKPFIETWNTTLNTNTKITPGRTKHLNKRIEEKGFTENFELICKKIKNSDFLMGKNPSPGHKNWKATFDWIIKNEDNYVKVLEGNYDNKAQGSAR